MKSKRWSRLLLAALCCAWLAGTAWAGEHVIGEALPEGDPGAPAQTLFASRWLRSGGDALIVRLGNGRTFRVAEHSSLWLEAGTADEVRVVVGSGRVDVAEAAGRIASAGTHSRFTLGPALSAPLENTEAVEPGTDDQRIPSARPARRAGTAGER